MSHYRRASRPRADQSYFQIRITDGNTGRGAERQKSGPVHPPTLDGGAAETVGVISVSAMAASSMVIPSQHNYGWIGIDPEIDGRGNSTPQIGVRAVRQLQAGGGTQRKHLVAAHA